MKRGRLRKQVFLVMKDGVSPPDIYRALSKRADRAHIYRALNELVKVGLIKASQRQSGQSVYGLTKIGEKVRKLLDDEEA